MQVILMDFSNLIIVIKFLNVSHKLSYPGTRLIDWYLMPTLAIFQLYRGG